MITEGIKRRGRPFERRRFLLGASGVVTAGLTGKLFFEHEENFRRESVFIARAPSYSADLGKVVEAGLKEIGIGPAWVRDKAVMLKPNLVEPSREAPHINTHPGLVLAVAETFLKWKAREVVVAEGPGHSRDTAMVIEESGLVDVLDEIKVPFVDLNHGDVYRVRNELGRTKLEFLYLPVELGRVDRVVSMPKMKTHHWAGVTLSMKNLFGVLPGICYGWPKNVLHVQGITQSVLDINATVRPDLAIVDGIVGMEGDGPIMGDPKHLGVVVLGRNLPAVDATAARLMGFDPWQIDYLRSASGLLGPIGEYHIEQRGETVESCSKKFRLLDHPHLQQFRPAD